MLPKPPSLETLGMRTHLSPRREGDSIRRRAAGVERKPSHEAGHEFMRPGHLLGAGWVVQSGRGARRRTPETVAADHADTGTIEVRVTVRAFRHATSEIQSPQYGHYDLATTGAVLWDVLPFHRGREG